MLGKLWDRLWAFWHRHIRRKPFYKDQTLKDQELAAKLVNHARGMGVKEEDVSAWICGYLCGAQGALSFVNHADGDQEAKMKEILNRAEQATGKDN